MDYKDYYQILGVPNTSSGDEIKRAYRRLAMQCHPDRNQGKEEWAHRKFKEINEAFSVLGDPDKKRKYDQFGTVDNICDIFGSEATGATFEDIFEDFNGGGQGFEFFEDILGSDLTARSFRYHRFRGRPPRTGRTIFETQAGIDLEDLFKTEEVSETSASYEIVLNKEQAFKGMEKELIRKGKRLKVKIPPGVTTGSRIRLRNALETTDGQTGDIVISITVK